MDIQTKDGILLRGIPDGTPDEVIKARIAQIRGGQAQVETAAPAAGATLEQKVQSSAPMRLVQGMRDPIDAGAQTIAHSVPNWIINAVDYIPSRMRNSNSPLLQTIGDRFFADPRPQAIDQSLRESEQKYQSARQATAPQTMSGLITGQRDPGFDGMRLLGNVVSPVNAGLARMIPGGAMTTAPRMAATGTGLGAAGGLLTPVLDEQGQQDFLSTKGSQVGLGALTGGILTPVMGTAMNAAAPYVGRAVDRLTGAAETRAMKASFDADNAIKKALEEMGQKMEDIPQAQFASLRNQVTEAMRQGKTMDAAAMMRKLDFDAMNLPSTAGQISRDPMQFARERNLRGVAGIGDPLMQRFDLQNKALQRDIGMFANGASESTTAADRIMGALGQHDAALKRGVNEAYGKARDHVGRAAPMDPAGFSTSANRALDESMLGIYLPAEARSYLNGIAKGEIPFNVQTAVQIDQVLSSAQRAAGNGTPQFLAIGKVRDSLNSAQIADNVGVDAKAAFDAARGVAKDRFAVHEAVPALKAVVEGTAAPDSFVRRFVLGGQPKEVKGLAEVLRQSPEAFREARSQIGAQIQRAAFGENLAGDKVVSPERLAQTLRQIGTERLSAFFSQAEIESMKRMARVSAYINSVPSAAVPNTSGTAATVLNLAGAIPGISPMVQAARAVANPVLNQRAVSTAMNPQVPQSMAQASPEVIRRLQMMGAMGGLLGSYGAVPR